MSLSNKLSITDVDVKGKRVLIRCAAAVSASLTAQRRLQRPARRLPDHQQRCAPTTRATRLIRQRIVGALPTIKYALEHEAKAVILMSHLGRPDGKAQSKYSLKPVADELSKRASSALDSSWPCSPQQARQLPR